MKKYIKQLFLLGTMVLGLHSCTEEELIDFSGESAIYFEWAKEGFQNPNTVARMKLDSMNITFAYQLPDVVDSLLYIPVKMQGYTAKQGREVAIKVSDNSTAIKGEHFSMPETVVIPADSVRAYIPVTFYRTEEMKSDEFSMILELLPNQNFNTDIFSTEKADNVDRELSYTRLEVTLTDILNEPASWFLLEAWLGPFSAKKLYLLAQVNEIPVPDYSTTPDIRTLFAQLAVLKAYLEEQRLNGTPVLEEDGSEMVLGPYA